MVLNSISNLNSLTSLSIRDDKETVCFPKEFLRNLTLLESLSILDWRELKGLPEDLASLVTLKSLKIDLCRKLESLPGEGLRGLESLQSLRIYRCQKVASLPASIQSLTKLQRIEIVSCGRELERRCEKGKGEDWYKIAHIPEVSICEEVLPCSWVMMAAASIEVAVASDGLLVGRFWAVYGSKVI
ncbi:Disease resistance protein RGA2 [Camellia lanceoleosa]|uniref:Disease resistance protein RGA2 n=1 Tax=Camellia lanceoleosa TaxID=1840588 RepID=A0ACC0FL48_9ERIC|nr:Disease resistance protein RGA2 [Camellia lanceoleosa]